MEYFRFTIAIPKRPWNWIRFRITTILLLIAILAIVLAWRRDHQQLAAEVQRLKTPYPHYEAAQATGPPNALQTGDSSSAWCPATVNRGGEWLLLDYPKSIVPVAIIVHENSAPGSIVQVTHVSAWGKETTLWQGTYAPSSGSGSSFAKLPVTGSVSTNRIRVCLDTSKAMGWNEIDAVGIVDSNGNVTWANGATASSSWGDSSTPVQSNSVWVNQQLVHLSSSDF